jgi:RND family efflux transporter MFP subunit
MNRSLIVLSLSGLLAAAPASAEVPFETWAAQTRAVERVHSAPGTLESRQSTRISAEVPGRVASLPFEPGDRVEAGETLVRLEDASLQAELAAANAQLAEARSEFRRTERLYEQDSASEQQFDKAKAALERAQAQVQRIRVKLDKTTISAPFSGVVVARPIEVGELAQPGTPLITLVNPERLRLSAQVQESRIPAIRANGDARVHVPATGDRFEAQKLTIIPQGQRGSHTFEVRLRLPEGAPVDSGMFGRAEFALGSAERMVVPGKAVVRRNEITGVYVVDEEDRVNFRLLELGAPSGDGYEVLAGLAAGERVALEPEKALRYLKQHQPKPGTSGGSH